MEPTLMNSIVLAYLGDAIFEVYVRELLIKNGIVKPHLLQKAAVQYVSAKKQSYFIGIALKEDFLNEVERTQFKRGRNSKSHSLPKNVDPRTYANATGFEAVVGMLYLNKETDRLEALFKYYDEVIRR